MHNGVSSGFHRGMRSLRLRAKSKSSLGMRWIGAERFMAMSGSDVWVSNMLGKACVTLGGEVRRRSLVACCPAANLISSRAYGIDVALMNVERGLVVSLREALWQICASCGAYLLKILKMCESCLFQLWYKEVTQSGRETMVGDEGR